MLWLVKKTLTTGANVNLFKSAVVWLVVVAICGCDRAQPRPPNQFIAIKILADRGDAEAQCNLGTIYQNGQNTTRDDVEAVKWYRRAAQQGNSEAQFNLGDMYANGDGVQQDAVEAYAWFFAAATGGNGDAAFYRDDLADKLTADQVSAGQKRAAELLQRYGAGK